MTQPVQEPTQGRVNQGLEFRTRQLFRRPVNREKAFAQYNGNAGTFAGGTETAGVLYVPEDHTGWTAAVETSDESKIWLTSAGRVRCSTADGEQYMIFGQAGGRYPSTAGQEFGLSAGLTTWRPNFARDDYAQYLWGQSPATYITRNHNQITATWLPVPDILGPVWFTRPYGIGGEDWFDCLPNWTPQNTYGCVIQAQLLIMEVAPYRSNSDQYIY